jgi:lysophospholipase L1-like esterase
MFARHPASRPGRLIALAAVAALVAFGVLRALLGPAAVGPCNGTHWIGAWADAPSDASAGSSPLSMMDASGHPKLPVDDATIRAELTPTYGGSMVRVHLSNRFGTTPAVFGAVTIALKGAGAGLAGPVTAVTFAGKRSVTLPPGADVSSDPVRFTFSAMQTLAVSMYVANDAAKPTEHYTARQTSYLTPAGRGDQASDASGTAFTTQTTSRDYVDGIDVQAPASAGAVVALGDSITDGYQGLAPDGVPEVTSTLNANGRWPDDLARRLIAGHIALSILNEGISGNRILYSAAGTGGPGTSNPSALSRLREDVLDQAGVTTVIWLEGINDVATAPFASAAQVEGGLVQGVETMHQAGLRVVLGTITPAGGAGGEYGAPSANAVRNEVNTWIREQHVADGYVDFDAAVRDPGDPGRIAPAYDGGDHVHLDLAGYQAMADAIDLALLRRPACTM